MNEIIVTTGYWFEIIMNLIMAGIGIGIGYYLGRKYEREKNEDNPHYILLEEIKK